MSRCCTSCRTTVRLENIRYLYVLEKLQRGLDKARTSGTLSQEEAEKRLGKWLTE